MSHLMVPLFKIQAVAVLFGHLLLLHHCVRFLKSSMCQITIHYFLFMSLFAVHQSYRFMVNPQETSFAVRVNQKSNAACRLPYRAFTSSTYNTILPFLVTRYGLYGSGSHCISKSMQIPLSFMCTVEI